MEFYFSFARWQIHMRFGSTLWGCFVCRILCCEYCITEKMFFLCWKSHVLWWIVNSFMRIQLFKCCKACAITNHRVWNIQYLSHSLVTERGKSSITPTLEASYSQYRRPDQWDADYWSCAWFFSRCCSRCMWGPRDQWQWCVCHTFSVWYDRLP